MNIEARITKIEGTKGDKYNVEIHYRDQSIVAPMDKEDLRYLIEKIDNEII
jgi:hypothetical protein